ncbi:MAG: flagellar hook-basal body complex protein FliE [Bryobacterales bacterium]|jgi:flagellar hook-basal body complex protein FliE|nr:flagellar hook-basal body complex protein FliE [Bryobacterales bacterium]
MAEIGSIQAVQAALTMQAATPAGKRLAPSGANDSAQGGNFATELQRAIATVDRSAKDSTALSEKLIRGESVELHTVALRAQEASMQFDLLLQVRNKLIQGYQEIMRLQV